MPYNAMASYSTQTYLLQQIGLHIGGRTSLLQHTYLDDVVRLTANLGVKACRSEEQIGILLAPSSFDKVLCTIERCCQRIPAVWHAADVPLRAQPTRIPRSIVLLMFQLALSSTDDD